MALETLHLINFLNEILLSSFFVCATNRQRRLLVSAEHKIKATNQKIAAGRLKTEESCLHHLPTLRGKKIVQRFLFVGRGNNSRRRTANFISFLYIHRPVAEFFGETKFRDVQLRVLLLRGNLFRRRCLTWRMKLVP